MPMKYIRNYAVAWAITIAVVLASGVFGVAMARADMLPVVPGNWVCDGAGVLSEETESAVRSYNAGFDQSYSAYVAVATVENLRGWEPDVYAEELFNDWELYGNDFLLLLDIGGGQSYLYHGSNYTDFDYSAYLDDYVNPDFYAGDYDAAVTNLFTGMESYLSQHNGGYVSGGETSWPEDYDGGYQDSYAQYYRRSNVMTGIILVVVALVVIYAVLSAAERSRYRRWYSSYGHMASPPVVFRPIFFWHRPGSAWWNRRRPGPRPGPGPGPGFGAPRPGPGPGPGAGPRPGGSAGPRPGARPGGFGGGGSARPGGRGGFGGGGASRPRSGGGFGGGGRSRGGHR